MIHNLCLGGFSKARIWDEELPSEAQMDSCFSTECSFLSNVMVFRPRMVAVEYVLPVGAMAYYGLLGARLEPCEALCTVQVVSESPSRQFSGSIANSSFVTPHVGLPAELVDAVILSASHTLKNCADIPACRIIFSVAAVDPVGSSLIVFSNLARMVTKLLLAPPSTQIDEIRSILVFDNRVA